MVALNEQQMEENREDQAQQVYQFYTPYLTYYIFLMGVLTTQQEGNGFYVAQFKTADLAIFSYYVEAEDKSAYIIDPTFDTKVYKDIIGQRGSTLKYIVLTHFHADFLSGHTAFGVPVIMGPHAKTEANKFHVTELKDGEKFKIGSIETECVHTPGHTPESSSYILNDKDGKEICIFTGDTVFLGDVGRPDLAASEHVTKEDLAAWLFDSIQKLKKRDGELRLYPGHGSGSACGKSIGAGNYCTLGKQAESNYGFTINEKEEFINKLTEGMVEPPKYFFHDAKLNHIGPGSFEEEFHKINRPLSIEQFQKAAENATVFDTRVKAEGGLIKGAYWVPSVGPMCQWISMVANPEAPVVFVVNEGDGDRIMSRAVRIGYFNVLGYNNFKIEDYPGEKSNPKVFNGKEILDVPNRLHLDVRNKPEWQTTGIIEDSILIPLPQLEARVDELKGKDNLVVNCRTGGRARFAHSILKRAGIDSLVIADKVEDLESHGHKFVKYEG